MRTVRVKVCGITREEDLQTAVSAGVDAIGFVTGAPSSPRNLTTEEAKRLIREVPLFVDSIVVTILEDVESVVETCRTLQPKAIQIHGGSSPRAYELHRKLRGLPMIRAVDANSRAAYKNALEASRYFDAVLLDSLNEEKHGGTGITHDWELSRDIRGAIQPKPLILAGGLIPTNVEEAVRLVRPYAVDVSSGVELSPGVKDPQRILEFTEKAKGVQL